MRAKGLFLLNIDFHINGGLDHMKWRFQAKVVVFNLLELNR